MSYNEYMTATFEQIGYRLDAHLKREEVDFKLKWEIARQQAFWILIPNLKKGTTVKSIHQFEWETSEINWDYVRQIAEQLPKPKYRE